MRVNVSKAFFSKTFMNGLKVLLLQRQLTKSNKKPGEFYLKLNYKNIKQTLVITSLLKLLVELTILTDLAIFANLLLLQLQLQLQPLTPLHAVINIFISFNVFSRLKFLMNDLRLKTFHSKSINSSKFIKKSTTTTTSCKTYTSTASSATTAASAAASASAAAAAAVVFSTSCIIFKQATSSRNNNHRTYNNSSKSNKVFLYYTPRDPHLRIFSKTKHFFNRPEQKQQQQQLQYQLFKSKNICCFTTSVNKNLLLKIFNDLCNYGELIGGGSQTISGENKIFSKQLNSTNLNSIKIVCDNITKNGDNLIVATAGAANETISAKLFIVIIYIAVASEYAKELVKSIDSLLRFNHNQQLELQLSNLEFQIGFYQRIV